MVRCPVCGKYYTNSTALLKHVRLKSRFDKAHEDLWREFERFVVTVADEDLKHLGKTELFRKFLELKFNGGKIPLNTAQVNSGASSINSSEESS